MASYFTYLMSSLPMLQFGMKPPFSFEKFIEICSSSVSEKELSILQNIFLIPQKNTGEIRDVLQKWYDFETSLRNKLVHIRAVKKGMDPNRYLRSDDIYFNSHTVRAVHSAQKSLSMLESEKILDAERWRFLDEISLGHYFDMDILIIYALKLLLLEKWHKITTANAEHEMDAVVGSV